MAKKPLAEQVVVVTGGSAGLGRAVARLAASRGASVVVARAGRRASNATVAELGGDGVAVEADVSSFDECHRIVERAVDAFGRIDTFCANAMVTVYQEARDLEPDELRRVLDVNFLGAVHCYWASLPQLIETRGTFVACQLGPRLPRHPAAGRLLLVEGGAGAPSSNRRASSIASTASRSTSRSPCPARSTRRSSTWRGSTSASSRSRCRRSTSRRRSPRRSCTPSSTRCASCPVGWGSQKLLWGQKLSPRLGDLVLLRNGWKGQHTGEEKRVGSPDNLDVPLPGDHGARGRFSDRSRERTVWTTLRLSRVVLGMAAVGAGLATMAVTNGRANPLGRKP